MCLLFLCLELRQNLRQILFGQLRVVLQDPVKLLSFEDSAPYYPAQKRQCGRHTVSPPNSKLAISDSSSSRRASDEG